MKFAWTLAIIVAFICGMYFNVALEQHRQYQVEYQADVFEGNQE